MVCVIHQKMYFICIFTEDAVHILKVLMIHANQEIIFVIVCFGDLPCCMSDTQGEIQLG